MNRNFTAKELIIPIIIIFISSLTILRLELTFSTINALIGIVGAILFFYKVSLSSLFIRFWLLSQIIIVKPYFDFSQAISFKFEFLADDFQVSLNILPLFLIGFLKIIEMSNLVGKKVTFLEFRETVLGEVFPLMGTILSTIEMGKSENYLVVKLDNPIMFEGKSIYNVLTKAKDPNKTIKLQKKNQIGFLRLVLDELDLNQRDVSKFPFIDWVKIY